MTDEPTCLVFLPALGQLPTDWQEQVTAVPPQWRCWVPWLRGMKPTDRSTFELDAAVADLVQFLEQHGVRRTHLVGLSLGAIVATRMAASRPELVDHLVLAGQFELPSRAAVRAQRTALRLTPRRVLAARHLDKVRVLAALHELERLDPAGDRDRVTSPVLEMPGPERMNQQDPEEFNRRVLGFLSGQGPEGPS